MEKHTTLDRSMSMVFQKGHHVTLAIILTTHGERFYHIISVLTKDGMEPVSSRYLKRFQVLTATNTLFLMRRELITGTG